MCDCVCVLCGSVLCRYLYMSVCVSFLCVCVSAFVSCYYFILGVCVQMILPDAAWANIFLTSTPSEEKFNFNSEILST